MVAAREGRSGVLITAAILALAVSGGALLWARNSQAPVVRATIARSAGAKVFGKWCSDCHSTPTGSGSMALQRKYGGNPSAIIEQRSDLNADYVKQVVRHGISFMPSFRKTEISDAEVALLGAYLTKSGQNPTAGAAK
jgi:mono/diheme cytochrome c family protein